MDNYWWVEVFFIECFHMTSRRPYWCPKTMKRRPCWCPKPVLWELTSFLMQTLSFVLINLHRSWPREWKHSITILDAVATVDVITANNTDVNLVETRTVHFLWQWNRHLVWKNKQTRLRLRVLTTFIPCFPPWNITWHFAFIPSILQRVQRLLVSWKKKPQYNQQNNVFEQWFQTTKIRKLNCPIWQTFHEIRTKNAC